MAVTPHYRKLGMAAASDWGMGEAEEQTLHSLTQVQDLVSWLLQ